MTYILTMKPRMLTAKDLLDAGCPLKVLLEEGRYTKAELLCAYRDTYKVVYELRDGLEFDLEAYDVGYLGILLIDHTHPLQLLLPVLILSPPPPPPLLLRPQMVLQRRLTPYHP
jgi:hypothetical protein